MSLGKAKILSQGAAGGIVGTDHFDTVLWTGNATTRTIPVNFQPDFVWIKARTFSSSYGLYDSLRGAQKWMSTAFTSANQDSPTALQSFTSAGFTLGTDSGQYGVNRSGVDYVAWNWYAPTSETNNNGNVTGTIKKNVDAGFSIVNYTATSGQTVGHGLDGAPDLIIKKALTVEDWLIYSSVAGTGKYMSFTRNEQGFGAGSDGAVSRSNSFNTVNSTVFSDNWTSASLNYIAYCFKNVAGYQKIGSYNGTGNAGIVVEVGFTPSFLLVKRMDSGGTSGARGWFLLDNKRNTSNPRNTSLEAQAGYQDNTLSSISFDFDATSFKVNGTNYQVNQSGGSYLYLAIA